MIDYRFVLILISALNISCGGLNYTIKNNTGNQVHIRIESYDTMYCNAEKSVLQRFEKKNQIKNLTHSKNAALNTTNFEFDLHPDKTITYKTSSWTRENKKTKACFIGYKPVGEPGNFIILLQTKPGAVFIDQFRVVNWGSLLLARKLHIYYIN